MGLYSLNPQTFQDADRQLAEQETRREWPKLHGEAMWENDIERANRRIGELEAEVARLTGAMAYLEQDKVPWLERELARERNRQWAKR